METFDQGTVSDRAAGSPLSDDDEKLSRRELAVQLQAAKRKVRALMQEVSQLKRDRRLGHEVSGGDGAGSHANATFEKLSRYMLLRKLRAQVEENALLRRELKKKQKKADAGPAETTGESGLVFGEEVVSPDGRDPHEDKKQTRGATFGSSLDDSPEAPSDDGGTTGSSNIERQAQLEAGPLEEKCAEEKVELLKEPEESNETKDPGVCDEDDLGQEETRGDAGQKLVAILGSSLDNDDILAAAREGPQEEEEGEEEEEGVESIEEEEGEGGGEEVVSLKQLEEMQGKVERSDTVAVYRKRINNGPRERRWR